MAKLPSKVTQFDNKMLEMLDGEFWNFAGTSFSFPELSHRSKYFADLNTQLTDLLRTHFNVPANYQILFLHNGLQYCSIPFNLLPIVQGTALYLVSTLLDSSSPCSSLNP